MSEFFSSARKNVVRSYRKYKAYYDLKCEATPLDVHSFSLLLDPKITKPNQRFEKQKQSGYHCTALRRELQTIIKSREQLKSNSHNVYTAFYYDLSNQSTKFKTWKA